jgi:hypothetical protein
MAKGQVRSTREIRKPKKSAAAKAEASQSTVGSTFGKSQSGGKTSGGKR